MECSDPFDVSNVCIGHKFNPDHPNISRVYTNVNLEKGKEHWGYRQWNPKFGDIRRYTLIQWLGSGRYSEVFLGKQDNLKPCAIKLLRPVNADRVRRELKILQVINEQPHPNVLRQLDVVIDGREAIPSLVTEYVSNAPWRALFQKMDLLDMKFYIYRILQALDHTHSLGVMHRDVKPLNILCDSPRKSVVLADWGLAEFYHPYRKYSVHVATRYYKSPEILLDYEYYDYSLDIWSVGVMLLEMLGQRMHVFDGGDNEHQIDSVVRVVGGTAICEWADKYRVKLRKEDRERFLKWPKVPYHELISFPFRAQAEADGAVSLLEGLLNVDQKLRLTAAEALKHPFFRAVVEIDQTQQ